MLVELKAGGEHAERTFKVEQHGEVVFHFQITGFYESWNGLEWGADSDICLVEPGEVTVVQYFAIGKT